MPPDPSTGAPVEPPREACTACRQIRRKCIREPDQKVCNRCTNLKLECIFKQGKRGPKPRQGRESSTNATAGPSRIKMDEMAPPQQQPMGFPSSSSSSSSLQIPSYHSPPIHPPNNPRPQTIPYTVGNGYALQNIVNSGSMHSSIGAALGSVAGGSTSSARSPNSTSPQTSGLLRIDPSLASAFERPVSHMKTVRGPEPFAMPYLDIVTTGTVKEHEVEPLFEYFFSKLNPLIALLDPVLHHPVACRRRSSILFSSVLTVAARFVRPELHRHCLAATNRLLGQAFEYGLCDIEYCQSLSMLIFWRNAADSTMGRKLSIAIRSAYELGLNVRAGRPLPGDELECHEILNRERTWIQLTLSDYSLALQSSMPRFIVNDTIEDVTSWILDHKHLSTSFDFENVLAPSLPACRLMVLRDSLQAECGTHRLTALHLKYTETELTKWKVEWIDNERLPLMKVQKAFITFVLRHAFFQLAESKYSLARAQAAGKYEAGAMKLHPPLELVNCVEMALGVFTSFIEDLYPLGLLPYAQDITWVATATTAIWIFSNISTMSPEESNLIFQTILQVTSVCQASTNDPFHIAGYTARLLQHLTRGSFSRPSSPQQPNMPLGQVMSYDRSVPTNGSHQLNYDAPFEPEFVPGEPVDILDPFMDLSSDVDKDFWLSIFPNLDPNGGQFNV